MPRPITELGRTRYSYKSQIEFLVGRMKVEKAKDDADTAELMVMYQSLIDSVNQAMNTKADISTFKVTRRSQCPKDPCLYPNCQC